MTTSSNITLLQQVESGVSTAAKAVASFVQTVETDGAAVVSWVEKEVPTSTAAFTQIAADAKAGAQLLATAIQNDSSGAISALSSDIETALANYTQVAKGSAASVLESDTISVAAQLANAAVSVGLTKVLALAATAA